jgi:DNA-3-methyladenine glycosylase
MKLSRDFYLSENVVGLARSLLGKVLVTNLNGGIAGGMITETEAYEGVTDRASHAYGNRKTPRTSVMYEEGGRAYVYLCYGMHHLFNVVTSKRGVPHAILIRGVMPVKGRELITSITGKSSADYRNFNGPAKVTGALGILTQHTATDLLGNLIWIEDSGVSVEDEDIISGPRVGIDYAGEDALLNYRFRIRDELIGEYAGKIWE